MELRVQRGRFQEDIEDQLRVNASFVVGDLRDVYITIISGPDDVAVALEFTSGDLRDVYNAYTIPPEPVSVGASYLNGDLRRALIVYTNYLPEAVGVQTTFLDGTLEET